MKQFQRGKMGASTEWLEDQGELIYFGTFFLIVTAGLPIVAWKLGYPIAFLLGFLCFPFWFRFGLHPFPGFRTGLLCTSGYLVIIINIMMLGAEWLRSRGQ